MGQHQGKEAAAGAGADPQKRKLKKKDVSKILKTTQLSEDEVSKLHEYFCRLADAGQRPTDGITKDIFVQYCVSLDLPDREIGERFFDVFDFDHSGTIDFKELAVFTSLMAKGSVADKLEYAFKLFDLDQNGYLDPQEVRHMLDVCLRLAGSLGLHTSVEGDARPIAQVTEEHVNAIFKAVDTDGNKKIDKKEFVEGAITNPDLKLVLDFFHILSHPNMRKKRQQEKREKRAASTAAQADAKFEEVNVERATASVEGAAPPAKKPSAAAKTGKAEESGSVSFSSYSDSDGSWGSFSSSEGPKKGAPQAATSTS